MTRFKTLVLLGVVLVSAILIVAAVSAAVEPDTGFEIEGNIDFDGGAGALDWWNYGGSHQAVYPPAVLIADPHSKDTTDCNTFKPAGKFDEPQNWSIQDGNVGASQDELTNIFAYPVLPGDLGNTDAWLIMAMERTKKAGTFALDFEFNRVAWSMGDPCVNGTQLGGPIRTPGDVAVGFELKGNPTDPQKDLQVLIVQFVGPTGPAPQLCDASNFNPNNQTGTIDTGTGACPMYSADGYYYRFLDNAAILADSGLGTATMNSTGFTEAPFAPGGGSDTYQSYDAQGNKDTYVGPFEFAEAAINLSALGIEPQCPGFGSVHAKSRSSLSVGSDLKDLAGPRSFPVQCYIEGHKYLDVDGNGDYNTGDSYLEGWTINLYNDDTDQLIASTTTTSSGYYRFDGLSDGNYRVEEDCSNQGTGWVQTEPPATTCGGGVYTPTINLSHRSEVDDFGNGSPDITITKTCTGSVFVGDDISYKITVTNTGNVNLSGIDVNDSLLGSLDSNLSLAAGASKSYTPTYTTTTAGTVENTASTSGDYDSVVVSDSAKCATNVYALKVTKDAATSFTRTFTWHIDKSVDKPGPITLAPGTSVDLTYTVEVNVVGVTDSKWAATGMITVENPAPDIAATLDGVSDVISPDIAASVSCPSLTIPAGGSLTCTYSTNLPNADTRTNTATATLKNNNGGKTDFTGTATVDFSKAVITYIDEEVTVTDTYAGYLGTANVLTDTLPKQFTYTRTVTADASFCGSFMVDNTATLTTNDTGTTDSDDVHVEIQVPCNGCTPGFWQGGAGAPQWDEPNDPDWTGDGTNPFIHTTKFNEFFNVITDGRLKDLTMIDLVGSGGTSDSARRAARDMVAAYLNESAFSGSFPAASLPALEKLWYDAVGGGDSALDAFHTTVSGWNDPSQGYCPLSK